MNAKRVSAEALAQVDVLRRVPPKMEEPRAMPVGLHIERCGKYQLTINRGSSEKGQIYVKINGKTVSKPLSQGQNQAIFTLNPGKAKLNVWVQEAAKPYVPRSEEDTIGDVLVKRLDK